MKKQELVYEINWLIERVYRESDKLLNKISDTSKFEERCINSIGEYLSLSEDNKRNKRYLIRLIDRKVKEAISTTSFSKEESIYYEDTIFRTGYDEDEIEFEPEDPLARVEDEVIANETIALLAQDDRSEKVLEAWSIGNTNSSEISSSLARTIGGNPESHRKFIQRFKIDCREKLATAI